MACVKDVDQSAFVVAFADFLKNSGKVKVPAWTDQVKTATHKELSPYNPDWWVIYFEGKLYGSDPSKNTLFKFTTLFILIIFIFLMGFLMSESEFLFSLDR